MPLDISYTFQITPLHIFSFPQTVEFTPHERNEWKKKTVKEEQTYPTSAAGFKSAFLQGVPSIPPVFLSLWVHAADS